MRFSKIQNNSHFVDPEGRLFFKVSPKICWQLEEFSSPQQVNPLWFKGKSLTLVAIGETFDMAQIRAIARFVGVSDTNRVIDMTQYDCEIRDRLRRLSRRVDSSVIRLVEVDRLVNAYFGDLK